VLSHSGQRFNRYYKGGELELIGWRGLCDVGFWGVGSRLVGQIDVPDLELIPQRYDELKQSDGLEFRAGLELRALQLAVSFVSTFMPFLRLERFAYIITQASKMLMSFGTSEGAYMLKIQNEQNESVTWSMVASDGFGVLTPCIASAVMSERIVHGKVECGARALMGELTESDIRECVSEFPFISFFFFSSYTHIYIHTRIQQAMCDSILDRVPNLMKQFHLSELERKCDDVLTVRGVFDIIRPNGMLANLVATCGGLPHASSNVETRVDRVLRQGEAGSSWRRAFGDQILASELKYENGLVMERFRVCFGLIPVAFAFHWVPIVDDTSEIQGFRHVTKRMYVCGIPVPRFLMLTGDGFSSRVDGRSGKKISSNDGGWFVRVDVVAPIVGHLVTYKGRIHSF